MAFPRTQKIHFIILTAITLALLSACSGGGGSGAGANGGVPTGVALSPDHQVVLAGQTLQMQAALQYSDGSSQDVAAQAQWISADPAIATVDATGLVTGVAPGTVAVVAQEPASGLSATVNVKVSGATLTSLAITPATGQLAAGSQLQLAAKGAFSDGSTGDVSASVAWSSQNSAVAGLSANGRLSAQNPGQAQVSAAHPTGLTASARFQVTSAALQAVSVQPATAQIYTGQTQPFTATGHYSDGTSGDVTGLVDWSSADTAIASVAATGLAAGLAPGLAAITATDPASGLAATAQLDVRPVSLQSVSVAPAAVSLAKGLTHAFSATAHFTGGSTADVTRAVVWSSSDAAVAAVDQAGLATAIGLGGATITATDPQTQRSASGLITVTQPLVQSLAVTPANGSVALGLSAPFKAVASYSDGSTADVTALAAWSSANPAIATVDPQGVAASVGVGQTAIMAQEASSGLSASALFTVTPAVIRQLQVSPAAASVAKGLTRPFSALATYSDGSTADVTGQVSWSSNAPMVATVAPSGLASAVNTGTAAITALHNASGLSGQASLTVVQPVMVSLAITPANTSVRVRKTVPFTATAAWSDATLTDETANVAWSSSNTNTATITASGLAQGMAKGRATITATHPAGLPPATASLRVR